MRLSQLAALDLHRFRAHSDADELAVAITRLPSLRSLRLVDWPEGLVALTALECLDICCLGGDSLNSFEAALGEMARLTSLSLYSEDMERLPPTLSGLHALRRACFCTINCHLTDFTLPVGPWLASLRWLGKQNVGLPGGMLLLLALALVP